MQAWDEVLSSAPIPYRAIQLYYGTELCPIWRGGQPSWGYICWDGGNHAGKKILCAQWLASARMPLSSKVDYTADNPNFAMPSEDLFSFQHRNRRIPKEFCLKNKRQGGRQASWDPVVCVTMSPPVFTPQVCAKLSDTTVLLPFIYCLYVHTFFTLELTLQMYSARTSCAHWLLALCWKCAL